MSAWSDGGTRQRGPGGGTTTERHLAILGPVASGKTSVGVRVAQRLGLPWFDSDDQLLAAFGENGRAIAAREGVAELHRRELLMLHRALSNASPVVVSPAASTVDSEAGRSALARGDVCCVLLLAEVGTIVQRLSADDHRRPLGRPELERLLRERMPAWRSLAAAVYHTDGRDPDSIAAEVAAHHRQCVGTGSAARGGEPSRHQARDR